MYDFFNQIDAKTIISNLLGCFTTIVGLYYGNHFNKKREIRKEFNEAGEKFTIIFQSVLYELEFSKKKTYEIISPELENHRHACAVFGRHLRGYISEEFWLACKDYFPKPSDPADGPCYPEHHYSEYMEEDEKALMRKKIKTLLEFAKYKSQ
jgi:hypothetical protein